MSVFGLIIDEECTIDAFAGDLHAWLENGCPAGSDLRCLKLGRRLRDIDPPKDPFYKASLKWTGVCGEENFAYRTVKTGGVEWRMPPGFERLETLVGLRYGPWTSLGNRRDKNLTTVVVPDLCCTFRVIDSFWKLPKRRYDWDYSWTAVDYFLHARVMGCWGFDLEFRDSWDG
jgi:hypothetical protein